MVSPGTPTTRLITSDAFLPEEKGKNCWPVKNPTAALIIPENTPAPDSFLFATRTKSPLFIFLENCETKTQDPEATVGSIDTDVCRTVKNKKCNIREMNKHMKTMQENTANILKCSCFFIS